VLDGETPRLIDEWQRVPDIWNQVKDNLDILKEVLLENHRKVELHQVVKREAGIPVYGDVPDVL
jgi:hypothetical protein